MIQAEWLGFIDAIEENGTTGSSTVRVWSPAFTSWVNFSRWRATARMARVSLLRFKRAI